MSTVPAEKPLLATVLGKRQETPPIWIMRQAGRYLPEYRELRGSVGGFLELCYTPALAAEVTLQPLKRFDLDAAILFSDILVVPDALGQEVRFETGEGPLLEPITPEGLGKLRTDGLLDHLAPVLETLSRVKAELAPEKTLIGFCGSPWTVATYMIGGRGSPDQAAARLFALQQPQAFATLIDILVEASITYLVAQFGAGADVVQLFESWALNLDETAFAERVIEPNRRIVEGVRREIPGAPIIGFPRGAAG
ncbi:MAG: uroporphyrinogen decarboxylase family protein, partial [Dehalococcoidia bacterium]